MTLRAQVAYLYLPVLLAVLFTYSAHAAEDTFPIESHSTTLMDVLQEAYEQNPTLQMSREELKATKELIAQANAGWKPTLSASAGVNFSDIDGSAFGSATGTTEKDIGLNFSQPLFRGGRTRSSIQNAEETVTAQEYALQSSVQDILYQAATAYMDVIRDRALLNLSEKNKNVITQQLEATQKRFEVGELTRTDVAQAEARLSAADADLINAAGSLRISTASYEKIIGHAPSKILEPANISFALPATLFEALEEGNETAPAVQTAKHQHAAAEKNVDTVFGELLPEINLTADWQKSYDPQSGVIDESTTASAGILASISLYQGGAVRSRIREQKFQANQYYINILDQQRISREKITAAWESLSTARAEIEARNKQVQAARIAKEGVYKEEQLGIRTILDTLDADQELLNAEVSLTTAQRNEIVAMFSLAAALGRLSPEYLGFSDLMHDKTSTN